MRTLVFFIIFILLASPASAQVDSFSVMQYNLLNYRNLFSGCDSVTNNGDQKDIYLKTILEYRPADILAFNEMAARSTVLDSLKSQVMDQLAKPYEAAAFSASGYFANAFFYNSDKFELYTQDSVIEDLNQQALVRQADVYTLYVQDPTALQNGDTTFLCCYVVHLKAGNTQSNQDERQRVAAAIMGFHQDNYSDCNYMLLGDLNVRSASEDAFVTLNRFEDATIRFYDPLEQIGDWYSNSTFAGIHTQSTRSSDTNEDCFSGGGLDDRLDFILCGAELMHHSRGMSYVTDSYKALGNDGLHFNTNIKAPSNSSVPSEVLNALYEMSDHLPVTAGFFYDNQVAGLSETTPLVVWVNNPIRHALVVNFSTTEQCALSLYDVHGKKVWTRNQVFGAGVKRLVLPPIAYGHYVLHIETETAIQRQKVIKL